jgi:hypothetical protein
MSKNQTKQAPKASQQVAHDSRQDFPKGGSRTIQVNKPTVEKSINVFNSIAGVKNPFLQPNGSSQPSSAENLTSQDTPQASPQAENPQAAVESHTAVSKK